MATTSEQSTEITTEFATSFNAKYDAALATRLDAIVGLPPADKTAILDFVITKHPLLTAGSLSVVAEIEEFKTIVNAQEVKNTTENREALEEVAQKIKMDNYDPQSATEGFKISEPIISSKAPTTNIPDITYSPKERQHFLKVFIDKALNLIQVNKQTKQVDFYHSSGSFFKVDGGGNITEYIKGNYKRVILGSYSTEVRGSCALYVKGDNFIDTDGNVVETIAGATTINAKGDMSVNGAIAVSKSVQVSNKVSAATIEASGSMKSAGSVNAEVVNAPLLNGKASALQ